jgi:peptide/nickel transport system permease protein
MKGAFAVLLPRLGNTALLMGASFCLALALAVPLGIAAARKPGSWVDGAVNLVAFAFISVPSFWLALMLIFVFAVALGWLPAGGVATVGDSGVIDRIQHLALPVATLGLASMGGHLRYARAAMIEALSQDYIRTARAKGAGERRVLWRHALPNALVPVLTILGLQFSFLLAGGVIIENVFFLPGLGRLVFQAIEQRDLIVVQSVVVVLVLAVVCVTFVVDLSYQLVNPRLSREAAP